MAVHDPRVDEYIKKSADFAKPILNYLRDTVHKACPDVKETLKWGMPHFDYAGSSLCGMAAFKQHCAVTFRLASLMTDPYKLLAVEEKTSMGHFGQIKSIADLPSEEILVQYIKEAMALNEKGAKIPRKEKAATTTETEIPPYFLETLKQNKAAHTTFEKFSPSHKKEYVEWITEAKTEATRNKRIATALQWLEEGKSRNWKYNKG